MRSTAARSSSSEIRTNSPPTTMALTVSRQPPPRGVRRGLPRDAGVAAGERAAAVDAAQRGEREQRGGLHLDGEDASLRPALVLALARGVEEVARADRDDGGRPRP